MTANVSYTPNPHRRENRFVQIENDGATACRAGLSRDACKLTGFERQAWMNGYQNAERQRQSVEC